jgi:TIR domain
MSETVAAIEVANAPGAKRPLVFISHATPQDNEFVLWLGTRLTALGYEVWADILKLRGGQDWTELLEVALKDRSAKLLLVATADGLSKKGVQREIKLAQQVAAKLGDTSFIIPLRKERYELTFDTALAQYIDFTENWGAGLVELTKTLQEYNVPRSGPSPEVAANWRGLIDNERAPVEIAEERLVSNALSITSLPKTVGIYQAAFAGRDLVDAALRAVTLPHVRIGDCLVGFCFPGDYTAQLNGAFSFNVRYEIPWGEFARDGFPALGVSGIDARRHLISLLRQHWDAYCAVFGLQRFEFAQRSVAWWPNHDVIGDDFISFPSALSGVGRRQLTGKSLDLHWHYGVSAIPRLGAHPSFTLINRVIFTTDGRTPVADAQKMHRLRRSRCKSWYSDRWRDLLLAFAHWLAQANDTITLSCGGNAPIEISAQPRIYLSNVRLLAADDNESQTVDEPDDVDDDNA